MESQKSRVVWVRTKAPSPEGLLNSTGILRKMVEAGLQELTGSADPSAAWSRYVRPDRHRGNQGELPGRS